MLLVSSLLLFVIGSVPVSSQPPYDHNATNTTSSTMAMRDVNIEYTPYERIEGLESDEYNYYDDEDIDCYSDLTRCIYANPQSYPVCAYDIRETRYVDFFDVCEIEFQNCDIGYVYTADSPSKQWDSPRYILTGDGYLCTAYLGAIPTPYSRRASEIYYNLLFDDEYYNLPNMRRDLNITELLKYHFKSPIFIKDYITNSSYLRELINNSTDGGILTNEMT